MRRRLRVALLAGAALGALVLANSALAAFTPKFVITHTPPTVSSSTTTVAVQLTRDDDALAKLTFYVPLGYRGTLGQAPGTQLGTVQSQVQATAISDDAIIPINGNVVVADGTQPAIAGAATQCTGTATHGAYWVLALEAAGQQLSVPVFIDTISAGPEAQFAQFKAQICLPPPATAAQGAKVLQATLALNNIFTAPTAGGQFVWPAIFTPYASRTGPINPAGTVQARAVVRLPGQLSLNGRVANKRRRTVRLTGAVTENRAGIAGLRVEIRVGTRVVGRATTGANGSYSITLRRPRGVSAFSARVVVPARLDTAAGCAIAVAGLPPAPAGCVSATVSPFTIASRTVRIRLR